MFSSPLCAACPHAAAGCCVAPPRYDWSDLARAVQHGHLLWLLEQLRAGTLVPQARGASVLRRKGRVRPEREAPRVAKCVFHDGRSGCTIEASQRPATCNFYVCEEVYRHGEQSGDAASVARARRVHDQLVEMFVADDEQLDRELRARWPSGLSVELQRAELLEWLGRRWAELRPARGRTLPLGR